jgi:hypothetical protein
MVIAHLNAVQLKDRVTGSMGLHAQPIQYREDTCGAREEGEKESGARGVGIGAHH